MPLTRALVADRLRLVIDPEIGFNIVDMGMVYGIEVDGEQVSLRLTMTTPACPMARYIVRQAEHVVSRIDGVEAIDTELVWQPSWSRAMMDAEAATYFQ